MSFPASPQNNQIAVINNITYTYSTASNTWTRTNPTIGYTVTFIQVFNANDKINLASGSDLIYDTTSVGNGIGYNSITGVFSLVTGKTYELYGSPVFSNLGGTYVKYEWVDATTNQPIASSGYAQGYVTTTGAQSSIATLIYTPPTNQTIKLRITGADGTVTLSGDKGGYAKITQIGISGLASNVSLGAGAGSTNPTTGALIVTGGLGVSGNINIGGSLTKSSYVVGEIIKLTMLPASSINQIGLTQVQATNTYITIASTTYTPVSASSYLVIDYATAYTVSGGGADTFVSHIKVNNNEIVYGTQTWLGIQSGTGTRSGVLFPLMGRFQNSAITPVVIQVELKRTLGDAITSVYGDDSTWLRITEIGR